MKYVEVVAEAGSSGTVLAIAEKAKSEDFRLGSRGEDGMRQMRMLVPDDKLQLALDALQNVLGAQPTARIAVMPVETCLPKADEEKRREEDAATAARESLYERVEKSARLDFNYVLLTALSTVVAAIGLIENNIAVVIGAMVIAPLLGPNLALSFGATLGDLPLMRKAARTLFAGIVLAVTLSTGVALLWRGELMSQELMLRTDAGLDSVALALASGAAAALSLTTGLSSVLVGVMVAVALLPPASALGLMLGDGKVHLALGAGLLLCVNVVCINLACKIVFLTRGIRPRTWFEKDKAKRSMRVVVGVWLGTLVVLLLIIYARRSLEG